MSTPPEPESPTEAQEPAPYGSDRGYGGYGLGYPRRNPHAEYWSGLFQSTLFRRQFDYPGRLGALGSLLVLAAVAFTAAFTGWVFLGHGFNHALAKQGAVDAFVRFFAYIFTLALFDYALLRAAQLVSRPSHPGPPPRPFDHRPPPQ